MVWFSIYGKAHYGVQNTIVLAGHKRTLHVLEPTEFSGKKILREKSKQELQSNILELCQQPFRVKNQLCKNETITYQCLKSIHTKMKQKNWGLRIKALPHWFWFWFVE